MRPANRFHNITCKSEALGISLPPDANPTEVKGMILDYEDVDSEREFTCPNYSRCLAYAADNHWSTFICSMCPKSSNYDPTKALNELEELLKGAFS